MTQRKSEKQSPETTENEIENAASEARKEEEQLQRLARAIRKILGARKATRQPSPDGIGREGESQEKTDSDERSVEWVMRLML